MKEEQWADLQGINSTWGNRTGWISLCISMMISNILENRIGLVRPESGKPDSCSHFKNKLSLG